MKLLLCVSLVFFSCFTFAQERAKVGLVLSGGGARGAAHVGVLKVLEEMNIPIDVVSGTSMGSIVGGLYASGMSAAEIEQALVEMDWSEALNDAQSRQYLSLNRKRQQDLFTTRLNPGLRDGQIQLPSGAIRGQNIDLALQRLTQHVIHVEDFDDLVIPFKAVATDLAKGEVVVLDEGDLAIAMRASMSVPSLFSPVELDGRILVDGGVTNNLPVDIAREMGADIVIVIDISTPLRDETQLNNLLAVTDQLMRLLTGQNTRESRESLTDNDILLTPDLGNITSSQFDRAAEAILIGETTARQNLQYLSHLSLSDSEFQNHLAQRNVISQMPQTVLQVNVDNQSQLNDEVIMRLVETKTQEPINLDTLENDVSHIYGLGFFEKVDYQLIQQPGGLDVDIFATPKSWGPNYLHFGFDMDSDHKGSNNTNFTFGYTRSEMNPLGGEWTTLVQMGSEPLIYSYFHQPLGVKLSYFAEPYFLSSRDNVGFYDSEGDQLAEVRVRQTDLGFIVGKEFGSRAVLSLGLSRVTGKTETLVGAPDLANSEFDDGGATINFRYDTLNNIAYPTSGNVLNIDYYNAFDELGANEEFRQWKLGLATVQSFGLHTIILGADAGGTESGQASAPKLFSIGGFANLSGLKENQRSGQYMGLLKMAYYRRFNQITLLPAYIGATVEYGNVWQDQDDIDFDDAILGGSLFLGLDSPVGPVLFGVGFTDQGDSTVYAKVGRFF